MRLNQKTNRFHVELLERRRLLSFTVGDSDIGIFSNEALAADFNNDLVQDLALSHGSPSGSTLSVRLGNGNGTFGAAQSFPSGNATLYGLGGVTESIARGDFNGDGNIDLALAKYYDNGVAFPTVLLGNGDGTLRAPQGVYLNIPPAPPGAFLYRFFTTDVAVADANADGRSDLLFVGEVAYLSNNGEDFYVYGYTGASLGNGNGGFTQAFGVLDERVTLFAAPGAGDFVAADLNADGKVDMVGANRARYGSGNGTFGAWQGISGPQGVHVAVDDFNGDGKLDIAATNAPIPFGPPASGGFVRLSNGNGTFHPAQSYLSGPSPLSVDTADFNGDGKADLVIESGDYSHGIEPSLAVLLGNGNGTFQSPLSFPIAPSNSANSSGVAVADFNGDGRADLAVTAYVFTSAYNLRVLLNDGNWATRTYIGPATGGNWSTAANWSPSGVPTASDLVAVSGKSVNLSASATFACLTLSGGATLSVAQNGNRVLRVSSLWISSDSKLNLNDNAVVIDYTGATPISAIGALLASGYNAGAWNGHGIGSSVAASSTNRALGFAEATDLFTVFPADFAGQSIGNTAVLIRFTLPGDATLDRSVNIADFSALATHFNVASTRWSRGDFNYDGSANIGDFGILGSNFNTNFPAPADAPRGAETSIRAPVRALFAATPVDGEWLDERAA